MMLTSPGLSVRWFVMGRTAWAAYVVLSLVLFTRGVPIALRGQETLCMSSSCSTDGSSLAGPRAPSAGALRALAIYNVSWEGILLTVLIALSIILLRRQADQRVALAAAFVLVGFSGAVFSGTLTSTNLLGGIWWWLVAIAGTIGSATIFPFLYLLPDGRFIPAWTRWSSASWAAICVMGYIAPPTPSLGALGTNSILFSLIALGFLVTAVVAQAHRYRFHANQSQRQQIKWVAGGVLAGTGLLISNLVVYTTVARSSNRLITNYIGETVIHVAMLMIPVAIVVAIARTHLWDIDRIINRALVYGTLSACLIGVYTSAVILLQRLFGPLTGQSDFAIALSTLVVAALFHPVRRRIQSLVDRRFYRQKYDIERALTSFSLAARDEVDLERLTGVLAAVIRETVQPSQLTVWLREEASNNGRLGGRG